MEILHSYWRMEYIETPKKDGEGFENPFVNLPLSGDDKKSLIVFRGPETYLVLNTYPYNPGHLLAVPYREVAELCQLTAEERNDLMDTIIKAQEILNKAFKPDGFNVGFNFGNAAGAGIPGHLHCHIVPRWNSDTNYMPVLGKTRVLPQALEETWDRLSEFC